MGVIESRQLPCQPSPCPPLYPTLLTLPSPCPPLLHTAHCFPFSSSARVCLSPTLSNVPYSALLCHTLPNYAYYAFYNTASCTLLHFYIPYSAHTMHSTILHTAHCPSYFTLHTVSNHTYSALCILHSAYLKTSWHTAHPCCNAQSLHIFLQRLHAGVGGG